MTEREPFYLLDVIDPLHEMEDDVDTLMIPIGYYVRIRNTQILLYSPSSN